MHFSSSSSTLVTIVALMCSSTAVATGVFSINATGVVSEPNAHTNVTLQVLNGNVGDAPTCIGTTQTTGALPASGAISCSPGYALNYTWDSVSGSIAADYSTPSSSGGSNSFTYNVPNTGCVVEGDNGSSNSSFTTCTFGFQDLFNKRAARRSSPRVL